MLLPTSRDGIALRHALEVRHESFKCREFVALARASNVAIVFADHDDLSRDRRSHRRFRLCPAAARARGGAGRLWRRRRSTAGRRWRAAGRRARARPGSIMSATPRRRRTPRDVFAFFISGAKVRNPRAAEALIGDGCNERELESFSPIDGALLGRSRRPTPPRSRRRSAARTTPSSPGGWCRRRGAASWCGCSARCCARRRTRSAGWSAGRCGKILSEGPRRGPGDDRHLRLRGRPLAPALRPHHRHRAAGPPDDGDLASAGRGRRDLGVQLPGRGLGVECLPRLRLRRQRGLEAVREDAALRRGGRRPCSRGRRSGSATRRPGLLEVVQGGREAGEALADDPRVPLVSATGSTRMGRALGAARRGALRPRAARARRQQCDDRRALGRSRPRRARDRLRGDGHGRASAARRCAG